MHPKSQHDALSRLPMSPTSFIGREKEIARVKELLVGTRLLTMTGAGGSGKTRLALQVASDWAADNIFHDGVWWVDLASVLNADFVPQAVANALGVRQVPDESLSETLARDLRAKQLFLVLDNCEHLITACAQLIEFLLSRCPRLRIMATSREGIGIPAEQVWLVPSLSLPDAQPELPLQRMARSEAIRLFVARAQAVKVDFALTDKNATAVMQVCQRLDGIPLAIELAATRVKVLTVEQIAARLDDRFNLLTVGSRTALPRHQTLRATTDWSYELLSEQERTLMGRLSVFVGGWTLEAAESICGGEGRPSRHVLDLLTFLVDKSLVIQEEQANASRYRMLETIREYAREKLDAANETEILRSRHLDFFLELAERAESELGGDQRMLWFHRFDWEYANVNAALEFSLDRSDRVERGLRLAAALNEFWSFRSHQVEGSRWLNKLLSAVREYEIGSALHAKATYAVGVLASGRGEYAVARALLEESVVLWRQVGDPSGLALALIRLAKVVDSQGDNREARALTDESTTLLRAAGDKWGLAMALSLAWQFFLPDADESSMRARLQESLNLFEEVGDQWSICEPLYSLGNFMWRIGKHQEARSHLIRVLPLARELDDIWEIATTHMVLAEIASAESDYAESEKLFEQSLATWRMLGAKRFIARSLLRLGHLAKHRGDNTRALSLFTESLKAAVESDQTDPMRSDTIAFGLAGFAEIWAVHDQALTAMHLLGAVRAILDATDLGYVFIPFPRFAQNDFDRAFALVQNKMDSAAFATAFADGGAMTMAQAVDYALTAPTPAHSARTRQATHKEFGGLTGREREIAALIAQGKSNRDISQELVLSERTVENHVGNILSKLHFHSRTQIAMWAVEKALVKPQV